MQEKVYLIYRNFKGLVTSIVFLMFRVFPIKKNKIVFCNLEGKGGYGCNPKYIAEELILRLKENGNFKLFWIADDLTKTFPKEINVTSNKFFSRVYHLCTAEIWIDNSRKHLGTLKRKNQIYIQTWHGAIGFKPVGKLRKGEFPHIAYKVSKNDSKMINYFLSNSEWCTSICENGFLYSGNVIKTGSPRCDILINRKKDQYEKIRDKYQLPTNAKIVMYAPTFRGGSQKALRKVSMKNVNIDFKTLISTLEEGNNEEWFVFIRLHPQIKDCFKEYNVGEHCEKVIDVTLEDDMYELLAGVDTLITDYSSVGFDASFMKLPVFIYADDLEKYSLERGELLWDLDSLPFPVSTSNEELINNIKTYNQKKYEERLSGFFEQVGLLEDGNASKRVVNLIERLTK